MTRRWVFVLVAVGLLLPQGCLGRLHHDRQAAAVALVPQTVLTLPVRESRRYWLLRDQPGWAGAHEVRFGGTPRDQGSATVRAVRFQFVAAAAEAYARLTPAHLHRIFRDHMTHPPRPVAYPVPLPGDDVRVTDYSVKLPPSDRDPRHELFGQLTVIRAATVVLVIESIEVHPEQLVPAIEETVSTARRIAA